ncbi:MAG TPA: hypothetical protein VEY31_05950, partial [Roseococcus sp.]|nr:hypothetical protein [Roseococcus sp.]
RAGRCIGRTAQPVRRQARQVQREEAPGQCDTLHGAGLLKIMGFEHQPGIINAVKTMDCGKILKAA